jgi:hypothetical protein
MNIQCPELVGCIDNSLFQFGATNPQPDPESPP